MSNPEGKGGFKERPQHINRKGRPKSFDQLRALAQKISHEIITNDKGQAFTVAELILREMAKENPARFVEIAFGKVPDEINEKHSGRVVFEVIRHDDSKIPDTSTDATS